MSTRERGPGIAALRIAAWCIAGAMAYGALSTIAPDRLTPRLAEFGTSTAFPYSQLLDFPVITGTALVLLGVIFLFVGIWRMRAGGTAALLIVGLAAGVAGGMHLYRAFDAGLSSPPQVAAPDAQVAAPEALVGSRTMLDLQGAVAGAPLAAAQLAAPVVDPIATTQQLTIVELNVEGDTAVHDAVLRDIVRAAPDLVVIVDAGPDYGQALADALHARGAGTFRYEPSLGELVVLINTDTTSFRVSSLGALASSGGFGLLTEGGSLVLSDGAGTSLYAVAAAERDRSDMGPFQWDLAAIASTCHNPGLIIVGDLGASMAAGPLADSDCTDAATRLGHGAAGTWPSTVPPWLGAARAHVLLGKDVTWRPQAIAQFDVPRSAHRGIVVTLGR